MADAKTRPGPASVDAFISAVENPRRRDDARIAVELLSKISGEPPVMWGSSIIGFGRYHYRYASGHEGDAPLVGFSPRTANLVFYFAPDEGLKDELLARLGRHKAGKGCLYVNRLSDVDPEVLSEMAASTIAMLKARYPA
ncbi:MAG: DUF1801 domain-containing protein [Brevundimonas sp.]|uniref:DUF1801 domain-containing protein n=1 Tax=Brevundimonas sp. TaxID=1871086 RepID=UPI002734F951|nr:DUF1801 domain-containing protein [Brevundimonas sp.]MDP3403138.1 DUF1801 domain-containing protein [Brevundimonas sp.]